ncbi:MAG: acylphosphatase [Pseudomonadota bacterium]
MAEPVARLLRIAGRVQGVGYRDWLVGAARALRIAGWVRNRADGSVEALIAGPADVVAALELRCADGPRFARISVVEGEVANPEGAPSPFERRATA